MNILLLLLSPGAAGSNVVFFRLLFLFVLLWFSVIFILPGMHFSSVLRLISRIEGVVWRGWTTSLICLVRIVWRQGAGHSRRTQDGDGSQCSKVPGGLAGRMLLVPQTAAATWRVLCALSIVFPLFFVFLCLQVAVFFFFFFLLVLFKCLPHRLRGGITVSLFLCSSFGFSLSVCFLCFLSFLYFIECVVRVCRLQCVRSSH